jgi:sodium transport system permease protein
MRARIAWTIFRKELTETLRDRRTLFMMVILPMLLYPLMIIAVSWFQTSQTETREQRVSTVAVWGEGPAGLARSLQTTPRVTLKPWQAVPAAVREALTAGAVGAPDAVPAPPDRRERGSTEAPEHSDPVLAAARTAIGGREIDAVVVLWGDLSRELESGGLGTVTVYYDSVRPDSVMARQRVEAALTAYRRALLDSRERANGLPVGFARALDVLPRNVASQSRRSAELLGAILPFILVVMSLLGGFYPAIDLTAGEKERGTMQTLLCAPLRPSEIIVGKFFAVWTMALIAALANVVGLAATLARIVPGHQLTVAPSAYVLTFLMLVPVTFIVAAVFLAVAAFARDFKDGQNFLTPVYMVLAMPAAMTMLPGMQLTAPTAFIPVLNIALLIKSLLIGEAPAELVFLTLTASAVHAMLAMVLAARVFQQEQVLLGGHQSLAELLGFGRQRDGVPSPSLVLAAYAAILVAVFYGSLLLEHASAIWTLVVTECGFFLVPTAAIVLLMGFRARDALSLRLPPPRGVLAAVLIGVSAWAVAGGLLIRLLPPPDSLAKALERILLLDGRPASIWLVWLVAGVTPAVCEELFFRGLMLSGLRRMGMVPAVLVTALLFGLAHSSIYRLLPTAFLGFVFGYVVWQTRSVVCSMIAHALNNGLMVTLVFKPSLGTSLGIGASAYLPWSVTAAGVVVMLIGLALVWRRPSSTHLRRPYEKNGPAASEATGPSSSA